jgi:hypothetical protein
LIALYLIFRLGAESFGRAEDFDREFGLGNLLSQGNNFRHFLEEPVAWKGPLIISALGHAL